MSKSRRLEAFFQDDGRTVILPIDHGTAIPVPGLEDPGALIEETSPYVDGYVVNLGLARAFSGQLEEKGVCLRTDCYKPAREGDPDLGSYRLYGADDAESAGADAMMNMLYPHHPNESDLFRECAELISEGAEARLPVILESLPFGIGRPADYTVENIGFAVRAAAELGADVVKTAYPTGASVEAFRAIVEACFVPVVVLGGAAMGDDRALLTMVRQAIDAGASGIAVGRNVWQHPAPGRIARALQGIVHGNQGVDEALASLDHP